MKIFKDLFNHFRENPIFYIIAFAFILRFPFRLPFLEDWDSVQFALALHNFSIVEHQPHPPGYPLYILMGKLLNIFIREDIITLNLLSTTLGSLSVLPFYLLVQKLFDKNAAILSSLLFIVIPVHWMFSETAFTDVPGLFFLLIVVYLLFQSKNNLKRLLTSSLFAGLILGFRFNEIPILLGLITLVALQPKVACIHGNLKYYLLSLGSFVIGILLWLAPLIFITGLDNFIGSYSTLANYVVKHDVFLSESFDPQQIIKIKVGNLLNLLNLSYSWMTLALSVIAALFLALKRQYLKKYQIQFLLAWIISYSLALFIVYNHESTRHVIPLFPPLIILITITLLSSITKRLVLYLTFFIFWSILFSQGLDQVIRLNKEVPATIQPVEYVRQNFNPDTTTVIASFTYRQFQYYAPEVKSYYSDKIGKIYISPDNTIVIDYLGLTDKIENISAFNIIDKRTFKSDQDIFMRIPETTIYILQRKI